jgi:hypothetical protein
MRRFFLVLALCVGAFLPQTASAQVSPTLTGESLSSLPPATITEFDCDNTGGTLSFTVSGVAAGPYPGTFTETGTVTLGARDIPIPGAPGQFRAPILEFEAEFTIVSPLGIVTGTKWMEAPSDANFGGCNAPATPFSPSTAQIIASDLRYEATLPDGTTDEGRTFANFNAYSHSPATSSSNQFREGFTSDTVVQPLPQCSDLVDNDNDGQTDFPNDPGCSSPTDNSESPNPAPQCSDLVDNDSDGRTDYPLDPGCTSLTDNSESPDPQCSDLVDNDNDGRTDFPADPGCESPGDDSESPDPARPASAVVLTPPADVNPVGAQHTVTAAAAAATGGPPDETTIIFTVEGASDASGSCTTDEAGRCTFTYTGPELPGADLITACADNDGDATVDLGEPCGEATKIWLFPATVPGQVTGGGWIVEAGENVSFGFNAQADEAGGAAKGNCNVIDHATKMQIKCLTVDSLVVTPTHATFFGQARVDGATTDYRIDVDDLGEPGLADTFKIQLDTGYTAGGTLEGGNIQIHK